MSFNTNSLNEMNILDLLNIFSLWAQIDNMNFDKQQNDYINKVIKAISNEIDKLHKENDIIMKQNKEILKKLEK